MIDNFLLNIEKSLNYLYFFISLDNAIKDRVIDLIFSLSINSV